MRRLASPENTVRCFREACTRFFSLKKANTQKQNCYHSRKQNRTLEQRIHNLGACAAGVGNSKFIIIWSGVSPANVSAAQMEAVNAAIPRAAKSIDKIRSIHAPTLCFGFVCEKDITPSTTPRPNKNYKPDSQNKIQKYFKRIPFYRAPMSKGTFGILSISDIIPSDAKLLTIVSRNTAIMQAGALLLRVNRKTIRNASKKSARTPKNPKHIYPSFTTL